MSRAQICMSPNPPLAGSSSNSAKCELSLEKTRRSWATQPIISIGCRYAALCGSIFASVVAVSSRADDDLPKRLDFNRYQGMLNRSPFAVATAVVVPSATPNFAKDLYVANAAKSSDGDMVTIASTSDKDFKKYLTTKEAVDGYTIANIEWSDKVGETRVTISKDGQFATLTFNQALLLQPAANRPVGVPQPGFQQPGFQQPAMQPGSPKAPQLPATVPAPTPHVRGVIQRNPPAAPATPAGQPDA